MDKIMSKMTAVEWLVEQIKQNVHNSFEEFELLIEQAKQMEKQQIKEAYLRGIKNYDPTFKSE
jgi:hypothetical protein